MATKKLRSIAAAFAVVHVIVPALAFSSAQSELRAARSRRSDTGSASNAGTASWEPEFFAAKLTPTTFLIISSPNESKIVYTELKNFKSTTGRTYVLIDSGLGEPCGIAVDRERGDLYVADRLAQKIFRYGLRVGESKDRDGNPVYQLVTDANRLTILSGRQVDWVTVDYDGDVFYSDQGGKSINKITAVVMQSLANGEIQADDLSVVSAKQQAVSASASVASSLANGDQPPAEPSTSSIMEIYQGAINPQLSVPGGVVADGVRLYWTNSEDGLASGSVVRGEVNPKAPPTLGKGSDPMPFPALSLSNNTAAAYGIAKSNTMVFYSSVVEENGYVFGVNAQKNDGNVYAFAEGLKTPRGLVWDGDNTVFVADQGANAVYSFPVGRLVEAAPLTKGVEFLGAYGLAIMTADDDAFKLKAGAARASLSSLSRLMLLASLLSLPFCVASVDGVSVM